MLWFPSKSESGRFWNNPNQIDHELQLWNMWSKMFANAIVSLLCNNCRNSCCCRCSPQWHHWKLPTPWSVISYIFHVFSCYTMKIIWSSNPLIQVSIQHFTRCDLSINRDSDPVPACPFRSNTRASLASDWTKEVGCGSGSSVRPWEDWQPSKGPVKPSSCWESMPSGDACWTRFGPSPDDANLQVSYCISITTMNNL